MTSMVSMIELMTRLLCSSVELVGWYLRFLEATPEIAAGKMEFCPSVILICEVGIGRTLGDLEQFYALPGHFQGIILKN